MNHAAYVHLALCCMAGAAGCASPQRIEAPTALAPRPTPAPYTIAQLGFGDAAHFGVCLSPACPLVKPKHIASAGTSEPVDPGNAARMVPTGQKSGREGRVPEVNILTLYFATGQSRLNAEARRSIDALVDSAPARRMRIAAHTDSTGTPAENGRVARERAATVMRYLRTMPGLMGVPVDAQAQALCCYVASNDSKTGRQLNRRVDIELIAADQQGAP